MAGRLRLVALQMALSAGQAAGSRSLGLAVLRSITVPLFNGDDSVPRRLILRGRRVCVGHGVASSPHTAVLVWVNLLT